MLENAEVLKQCSVLLTSTRFCNKVVIKQKWAEQNTKWPITKQLSETFQSFVRKLKLKKLFNQICLTADSLPCTSLSVCVRVFCARHCSASEKCIIIIIIIKKTKLGTKK